MAAEVQAGKKRASRPTERRARGWLNRALAVLLAGGLVAIGVVGAVAINRVRPRVVEDPSRVVELTGSLLDVDVPDDFRPRGTIEWSVGTLGSVRGAYYDVGEGDGLLMFVAVDSRYSHKASVREHIERVLRDEGGDTAGLVRDGPAQTRDVAIRGEAVPFTFETRRDKSGQEHRLVEGVVEGTGGQVLIAVRFRSEGPLTEEAVVGMLGSIR
jgi:hypothetical protein